MQLQKEKLSDTLAMRITETEHLKFKTLPWPKRKIIRLKLREVLATELAKV